MNKTLKNLEQIQTNQKNIEKHRKNKHRKTLNKSKTTLKNLEKH